MTVTRRAYDPWGNPRGTKPSSWVAPDENHGFLGQPADATTGLNLLGARNYDPVTGRFLTPDPLFEPGDPNQMGGYTYAGDNPASGADPSGLMLEADGGGGYCDSACMAAASKPDTSTSSGQKKHHSGGCHGFFGCAGHYFKKALPVVATVVTVVVVVVAVAVVVSACAGTVVAAPACVLGAAEGAGMIGGMFGGDCAAMGCGGAGGFAAEEGDSPPAGGGGDAAPKAAAEPAPHDGSGSSGGSGDAAADASAGKDAASDAACKNAAEPKKSDVQQDAAAARKASASSDDPGTGNSGTEDGPTCSFSPDTPVLMAGGKTKKIGRIKTGDKVESADASTGEHRGSREVVATLVHYDKDLIDVTVSVGHGRTATLHTTSKHPFWDVTLHTWVPAGKLTPGHALTAEDGHSVRIARVRTTPGAAYRYNLTVRELHTYYVVAGGVPVLVHNVCGKERHAPSCECGTPGNGIRGVSPASGDTVVLGLAEVGEPLAQRLGAMTFNGDNYSVIHKDGGGNAQWINEVNAAVGNRDINIVVDLGGLDDAQEDPVLVFHNAATKGRAAKKVEDVRGTEWEMGRIQYHVFVNESRPWSGIQWFRNGVDITEQMQDYTP
ncbi:polymorphic toxin-type HINT domain-containing protein [Streptomyces sp. NBC_00988]|nr:polymorphic toxin-type HINT domain-containing protein [Streptomyces sp. NBC_00988]